MAGTTFNQTMIENESGAETEPAERDKGLWLPALFAATLFISAFLLFLIQPLIAKMILPQFGGTPAVWNTCMLFFQAALLLGYGYAHTATAWLGIRRQAALHVALLVLPVVSLSLPIAISRNWNPALGGNPALMLLLLLTGAVGLPFFVVATSAPLLQKWFAASGHRTAKDPYFLYSASNLGSLLALLSYPFLIEPFFPLQLQGWLWSGGYLVLCLLTCACAFVAWRSHASTFSTVNTADDDVQIKAEGERISANVRLRWILLAFVPSSLMLGLTTYLTTDLAPIPLLWIIPLSLYLVTFIVAFARLPMWVHTWAVRAFVVLVLLFTFVTFLEARPETRPSLAWLIPVHLLTFFVTALVCHMTLAHSRPSTRNLTEYYLWISVGGVLGGIFNGLLAPMLFHSVVEYYLGIVLACLLMPDIKWIGSGSVKRSLDFLLPALLGMATVALLIGLEHQKAEGVVSWLSHRWSEPKGIGAGSARVTHILQSRAFLQLGPPLIICLFVVRRPIRFGLGIGAILVAGSFVTHLHENVLEQKRNFFGVVRVISPEERDLFGRLKSPEPADFHFMVHGNIVHGAQLFRPEPSRVPLAYFYPTGPVGDIFREFRGLKKKSHVAVVGLGAGTLASYGEPGQEMTFYEINPAVIEMAENPRLFTYLDECRARVNMVEGDARLRLREAPDHAYGMIVLDAFSSDAIPVHLLTREAFELYLSKLTPDGIIVMQMTNRYLDLAPLAGRLAQEFDLVCFDQDDLNLSGNERGKAASHWAVLARRQADLGRLASNPKWQQVPPSNAPLWTDDFSNLLGILKWKER